MRIQSQAKKLTDISQYVVQILAFMSCIASAGGVRNQTKLEKFKTPYGGKLAKLIVNLKR